NLRTDAFLIKGPNPLLSTPSRLKDYRRAGAGCIFVPFIYNRIDIQVVVSATRLPLNVL
ncbi:MAG: isocitrate lyase/phosphoenolpyruvate mutase family protein, partial [Rhizobacter sp.]|nr:isocitrate lyase/phosphoenolpyruvate mutase family protein [Ferruginibacter sp.]